MLQKLTPGAFLMACSMLVLTFRHPAPTQVRSLDGMAGLVVVAAAAAAGHGEAAIALDGGGGATRLVAAAAAGGVVTNALVGTQGEDSTVLGVLHADATLHVVDASTGDTLSVRKRSVLFGV